MRKIIIIIFFLFLSSIIYALTWEIKTDIGIRIELNDVTKDYNFLNQMIGKNYEYVEVEIYNGNPIIDFYFFPPGSKALFINKNEETFKHKDIYFEFVNKLSGEEITQYQNIIDKLGAIKLGYRESGTILLAFGNTFNFSNAEVFKIEFGTGLYIEYYEEENRVKIIDEYNKLNLEEE